MTHRVVCGDAAVDEVEGPGLAILVLGLEVVAGEESRRGGGADADVRQESILGDIVQGLFIYMSILSITMVIDERMCMCYHYVSYTRRIW
jgi:hypothetical protein